MEGFRVNGVSGNREMGGDNSAAFIDYKEHWGIGNVIVMKEGFIFAVINGEIHPVHPDVASDIALFIGVHDGQNSVAAKFFCDGDGKRCFRIHAYVASQFTKNNDQSSLAMHPGFIVFREDFFHIPIRKSLPMCFIEA